VIKLILVVALIQQLNASALDPVIKRINREIKRTMTMISFLPVDIDIKQILEEQDNKKRSFLKHEES
jgi:hypothetical protein